MVSPITMTTVNVSRLPVKLDLEHRSSEVISDRDAPMSEPTTGCRRDQLHKLSSNPIFQDLQSTLRSECDAQDGVTSALLASAGHVTTLPVTVRVSQINMRFLQLSSHSSTRNQAFQLQSFYVQTSAQLESARLTALGNVRGNPWLMNSINAQYDLQHHGLLYRVEQSLNLVDNITELSNVTNPETKVTGTMATYPGTSVKHPGTKHTSKRGKIPACAILWMTSWYDQHADHPYPTRAKLSAMAENGGISPEQIRKWFYNRRQRLDDVKTMGQIVNQRKRARTEDQDDILLEGGKFSAKTRVLNYIYINLFMYCGAILIGYVLIIC